MAAPSKYKQEMCDQVLELMAQGMAKKAVAKEIGIAYQTFLNYIDQHTEFAAAVEEGDNLAEVYWQKQYEDGALGKNKDVQPAMMIMYMKNRFKWTDRSEQTIASERLKPMEDIIAEQDAEDDKDD